MFSRLLNKPLYESSLQYFPSTPLSFLKVALTNFKYHPQVVAWGFSLKSCCEIFDKIRTKSNKKEWTEILLRDIFRNIFLENS